MSQKAVSALIHYLDYNNLLRLNPIYHYAIKEDGTLNETQVVTTWFTYYNITLSPNYTIRYKFTSGRATKDFIYLHCSFPDSEKKPIILRETGGDLVDFELLTTEKTVLSLSFQKPDILYIKFPEVNHQNYNEIIERFV